MPFSLLDFVFDANCCVISNVEFQESVGHKTNLLPQWDNGSYFLNFSLHRLAMRFKIE